MGSYHMKVHMVDLLVSNGAIVLQDVVVRGTRGAYELLESRLDYVNTNMGIHSVCALMAYEHFGKLVIGNVGKLCAVVFGDNKL